MVSTDLGACEWFLWDLRRSNLVDRGQLDQIVSAFLEKNPRAEPPDLAAFLVGQGILTQFQADRLLQGKTQGFVLGPYVLMDALGTGSMGTVYRAQSKNDNQWYAVKVVPRRSMWNVRLARRKVRVFEQYKHPSVVPFVDVGTAGGMHYLAWPLVEGEPLDKLTSREGPLDPGLVAHFAMQIAEGLDVFHQQGLFHGILKPSNLMVGQDNQIHILDFGIGSLLAESEGESLVDTMSTANSVSSGLDCASPESIMDPTNLTPLGDQYSLGCVMYYCLAGRYPFPEGTAAEKMIAQQTKAPIPLKKLNPNAPDALVEIVERLMKKAPAERYGSTSELVESLRPLANKSGSAPRPRPSVAPTRKEQQEPARPPQPRAETPRTNVNGDYHSPVPAPQRPAARPTPTPAARTPQTSPASRSQLEPGSRTTHPAAQRPPVLMPNREIFEEPPRPSRLGTVGVAIGALLLSVVVFLVTWKFF